MQTDAHPACWRLLVPALLTALLLAATARADSVTATVPVYLDYQLLRYLLEDQLFNTADGSREILNDPDQCSRIVLTEPGIGPVADNLQILAKVDARLGLVVLDKCVDLFDWRGEVGFLGKPAIQPGGRSVKLEPEEVWLVNSKGKRISSGRLWNAASDRLMAFFGGFVLDLAPYTRSVGALLPEVLPHRGTDELQAIVDSLTISDLQVNAQSLDVSISFDIDPLESPPDASAALAGEELAQLESRWQMMDALLVGAIKHYASATSLQPLRSQLLDILLDSRYRLRDALTEPPDRNDDAVRGWFIDSWHSLAPVVREIALEQPGQEQLLWFTALSATDALYALNQVGAAIGLEISTDGLRRLARMINAGEVDALLRYSEDVDPQLQQMLQEDADSPGAEPSAWHFHLSLFPRAHADPTGPDLTQWLPHKDTLGSYLPRVASLLEKTSRQTLKAHPLERDHGKLYEKLVLATAWQESCWRQFVVINKRIEPLTSTSRDVGLMQVNERVWRGFYDLQKLRWDINYNSQAGAEILINYMVKYALKRGEHRQPGGLNNLARASYSAYNGGPGQVTRYRRADVAKPHREIDRLFWEKYLQVDAGKALNVAKCLGQEL